MECAINILENGAMINGISLITSIVIPILVMIFTLHSQNKRAKKEREVREIEFQKTLQINDKYHQESMKLQEERSRVSQLPYLFLNQDIKMGSREGKYTFPLKIINIGNGTALEISVKYESDGKGDVIDGYPPVYKEQVGKYTKICRYTGFLFINALPVDSKASFELLLDIHDNGNKVLQEDELIVGEVRFLIKYKDTYYNEYEQDFMFQYSAAMGIGRVESYLPRLVKKNIEINRTK